MIPFVFMKLIRCFDKYHKICLWVRGFPLYEQRVKLVSYIWKPLLTLRVSSKRIWRWPCFPLMLCLRRSNDCKNFSMYLWNPPVLTAKSMDPKHLKIAPTRRLRIPLWREQLLLSTQQDMWIQMSLLKTTEKIKNRMHRKYSSWYELISQVPTEHLCDIRTMRGVCSWTLNLDSQREHLILDKDLNLSLLSEGFSISPVLELWFWFLKPFIWK